MEKKALDLKLVMMELCKAASVPYTNDFHEFAKRLHEAGFITAEDLRRIEQIGLQL